MYATNVKLGACPASLRPIRAGVERCFPKLEVVILIVDAAVKIAPNLRQVTKTSSQNVTKITPRQRYDGF